MKNVYQLLKIFTSLLFLILPPLVIVGFNSEYNITEEKNNKKIAMTIIKENLKTIESINRTAYYQLMNHKVFEYETKKSENWTIRTRFNCVKFSNFLPLINSVLKVL
ncbi:hypothetical protein [Spiroplasma endosymbiont of Agriotes lineatus]|uniref:hypothetical protein n=1 Tax=Spiroplasma endosymbiont of Agriotes lineatus TaxID=3077930 RepID=UPI003BAF69BD